MAELSFDVVERILVRLDVEDVIRCKSVCKSWYSHISSPPFVKAHLNHSYTNDRENHEFESRRIALPSVVYVDGLLFCNFMHIVGSCNGLVCISPIDAEFVVTNPSTREQKKLQTPPFRPDMHNISMIRDVVCWGFGYDSSADDYMVIAGFRKHISNLQTLFYALTLKSNVWEVIGEVKYRCLDGDGVNGILCGGALHWFMSDAHKRVIISLDLSTEEFTEIPQPTDEEYECHEDHPCDKYVLGVLEECLCIYSWSSPLSTKKWIMKNNKWEPYNDYCESKYDVAHCIVGSQKTVYTYDDGTRVPSAGGYIRASIFVKSLVSPHPRPYKKKRSMKRKGSFKHMMRKRSCKHKKPLIWI